MNVTSTLQTKPFFPPLPPLSSFLPLYFELGPSLYVSDPPQLALQPHYLELFLLIKFTMYTLVFFHNHSTPFSFLRHYFEILSLYVPDMTSFSFSPCYLELFNSLYASPPHQNESRHLLPAEPTLLHSNALNSTTILSLSSPI